MEDYEFKVFLEEILKKTLDCTALEISDLNIYVSGTKKYIHVRWTKKSDSELDKIESSEETVLNLIFENLSTEENEYETPRRHLINDGKFLTELVPEMKRNLNTAQSHELELMFPTVFYFDESNYQVMMANLEKQGYKPKELKDSHTYDEARNVLKSLAKFHAYSLVFINQIGGQADLLLKYPFLNEKRHIRNQKPEIVSDRWELFGIILKILQKFPELESSWKALEKYEEIIENTCFQLVRSSSGKFFDVINHGDLWNPNILFNEITGGPAFLDFHATRVCSPSIDLSYYIMISTNKFVKESLDKLLEYYYQEFQTNIRVNDLSLNFTLEEFYEDYKNKSKYGLFYGLPTCLGSDLLDSIFKSYETGDSGPEIVVNEWFQSHPEKLRIVAQNVVEFITVFQKYGEL